MITCSFDQGFAKGSLLVQIKPAPPKSVATTCNLHHGAYQIKRSNISTLSKDFS